METKETVLYRIIQLMLVDLLEVEKTSITLEANFEKDLGADSLDLYELLYQFETTLSVKISDEEAIDIFTTIGSLYDFLQPRCSWLENAITADDYWKRGNAFSSIYFALLCYDKSIELDANCVEAYMGRGLLLQKEEKYEEAINNFSKILEISPNYPGIFCLRGDCYLELVAQAQRLNMAGDNDPSLGMGEFRYNTGDLFTRALDDFSNAINSNAKDSEAFLGRGKTYYSMGKYDEAAKDYKKAMKIRALVYDTPEILDLVEKGFDVYSDKKRR